MTNKNHIIPKIDKIESNIRIMNRRVNKLGRRYEQIIVLLKELLDFAYRRDKGYQHKRVKQSDRVDAIIKYMDKVINNSDYKVNIREEVSRKPEDLISQLVKKGLR